MCNWFEIIKNNEDKILERAKLVYLTSFDIRHSKNIKSWTLSINKKGELSNLVNDLVDWRTNVDVCDIIDVERKNIVEQKLDIALQDDVINFLVNIRGWKNKVPDYECPVIDLSLKEHFPITSFPEQDINDNIYKPNVVLEISDLKKQRILAAINNDDKENVLKYLKEYFKQTYSLYLNYKINHLVVSEYLSTVDTFIEDLRKKMLSGSLIFNKFRGQYQLSPINLEAFNCNEL